MASDCEVGLLQNLQRFHHLQAERVETYKLFEEGFTAYLKGAPNYNFGMYKKLVNEITTTFQNISVDILAIEQIFFTNNRTEISGSIRKIQELEKKKLQYTAEFQMVRQKLIDEPQLDLQETVNEDNAKLLETVEEINDEMETLKYNSEDLYQADDS